MADFEIYESTTNTNQAKALNQQKYSGSMQFKIKNNKTGKSQIKFTAPYTVVPKLTTLVSVSNGSVVEVKSFIEKLDINGFIVHILNNDPINEASGTFYWFAEQF